MTVHFKPYKEGDKRFIDADPNDELNYIGDVRQWCIDNATTIASFDLTPQGVTVMQKGVAQGESNALLPVKLKIGFDGGPDTFLTFVCATTDGQKFEKTIWFKKVKY